MKSSTLLRRAGAVTVGAIAVAALGAGTWHGMSTGDATAAAPHGYHVVHGWPVLGAGDMLGSAAGVGVDSKDNVFVFHRANRVWTEPLPLTTIDRNTVAVFDGKTGALVNEWGTGLFAMPHGLTVDFEDNVWLTDVALQQIYKFSHDGKLLMTLGERGVAGDDSGHFNRPTDVIVAPDGSFYVSDGYRNTRVLKFARDGKFLFQWGTPGTGPGQFKVPHGVALDKAGHVYVADRGNLRVQVFDGTGKYLSEWKATDLGRPYGIAIGADGTGYVSDGGDQPRAPPDRSALVVLHADGSLIERVGRFGNYDGQFAMAHDVAVSKDGSVYVVDITGRRVQKFVPDGR